MPPLTKQHLNVKAISISLAVTLLAAVAVVYAVRICIDYCFHQAVMQRNREWIQRFALMGANVNRRLDDGLTPLMLYSLYGDDVTCRVLLARGARTDSQTTDGSTALFYALANRNVSTVRMLLLAGARPSSLPDADRCFGLACDLADESSVELLVAHGIRPVNIKALSARAKRHVSASGGDVEATSRRISQRIMLAR
jgi:ankyrin repeat protein